MADAVRDRAQINKTLRMGGARARVARVGRTRGR